MTLCGLWHGASWNFVLFGVTMVYSATIDDPGAYTSEWTVPTVNIPWTENGELIEYICQENNLYLNHLKDDLGHSFIPHE